MLGLKGRQQEHGPNSGRGRGMGVQANVIIAATERTPKSAAEVDREGMT